MAKIPTPQELDARIRAVEQNQTAILTFEQKFAAWQAEVMDQAASGGVDPESVPVSEDPAVWEGGRDELYRWARPEGQAGAPILIDVKRPPPLVFVNGSVTPESALERWQWKWKYQRVQAEGNQNLQAILALGDDRQANMDHQQAKLALYLVQSGGIHPPMPPGSTLVP